jgi:TPP-dependent pyruvate/acetoin dehydrogenase alpha subunit
MAIGNIALAGLDQEQLLHMHYQMVLLRRFEEKAAEEYTAAIANMATLFSRA